MRIPTLALAIAVAIQSPKSDAPWVADRGDGTFRNPIIYADYSDPDAIRVNDDFFMIASSFTAVPGIPILTSRDLVNWRLLGHALPRLVPEKAFATPQHGAGVWAPALRHHAGRFWIFYPDPDRGIYVTSAVNPAGPWSAPQLVKAGKGLIDPCPLWDDDGRAYLIHAWARSRAGFNNVLTLNRMHPDGTRVLDEGTILIDGNKLNGYTTLEGPKLYKRDGWYYVFAPAGGVKEGWQSVFRSKSIDGPYEARIVLAQGKSAVNGPHQGALVETRSGESWFLHFQDAGAYGRIVHLQPVVWLLGWPQIGRDDDRDGTGEPVMTWRKPDVARTYTIEGPAASDEFNGISLGLQWQWQANPQPAWSSLRDRGGMLRLAAATAPPGNLWMAPSLLLQKVTAPAFEATTAIDFGGLREQDRAGLIVFGDDYAWIGLRKTGAGWHLTANVAETAASGAPERLLTGVSVPSAAIQLRVTFREGARYQFSYSTDGDEFTRVDSELTAKPGRWVGAKVGVFAVGAGGQSPGHVDVDWFRVTK